MRLLMTPRMSWMILTRNQEDETDQIAETEAEAEAEPEPVRVLPGGGRAGSAFTSEERILLRKAFAPNGPPKGVTNAMVEMAKKKFPGFNPLWENLLNSKNGDSKKAKNTIFKAIGLKKKK